MGLDPDKSAYAVWVNKTSDEYVEEEQSEEAYWGNVLEDIVAAEFERRNPDYKAVRSQEILVHPRYNFMRANIDRNVFTASPAPIDKVGFLEIKTTSMRNSYRWAEGPPTKAWCQIQQYFAVTDLKRAWAACLIGGQEYVQYEVLRDDAFIESLIEAEQAFWDMVETKTMPPVDGHKATAKALGIQYADVDSEWAIELPPEIDGLLVGLQDSKAAVKAAEVEQVQIENTLKSLLGKAAYGTRDGERVVSWKQQSRNSVDLDKLRAEHPDVVKDCTKTATFRVLRTHGGGE
jgi:putative phage-type endonuclease